MRMRARRCRKVPYFEVKHHAKAVREKFRFVFAEAWKLIPREAQEEISDYWSVRHAIVCLCYEMDATGESPEPLGVTHYRENKEILTFLEPFIVKGCPRSAIHGVIGHELAHVYRRAKGLWSINSDVEERETSCLCVTWGFHPCSMNTEGNKAVETWRRENKDDSHRTESWYMLRFG